jgi:hypothetical protein
MRLWQWIYVARTLSEPESGILSGVLFGSESGLGFCAAWVNMDVEVMVRCCSTVCVSTSVSVWYYTCIWTRIEVIIVAGASDIVVLVTVVVWLWTTVRVYVCVTAGDTDVEVMVWVWTCV